MCEFNVVVEGKVVFKDVVYAGVENDKVIVKDILEEIREFDNCKIVMVDVRSARLILSPVNGSQHF